uniref:Uncharacterized protein n=1 Tax=Chelonoidis abingdonii TaxID=106734 RepID=A0A8C0H9J2_CHEAB
MIWENESDVIAMMTKEVELGKVKCHRYWPEPPQHSLDLNDLLRSLLTLIFNEIDCLQFTTWPDHGTPRLIEHLVKFICYMRKIHQTGPITAHCSAGIGRSGVLLCIDILLSCIEKDLCVSICKPNHYKYYHGLICGGTPIRPNVNQLKLVVKRKWY